MTAQMAKISGLFPLPGAGLRKNVMIATHQNMPTDEQSETSGGMSIPTQQYRAIADNPNVQRQQRRVYIGNLPEQVTEVCLQPQRTKLITVHFM